MPDRLEEAKRLSEAATPGPWRSYREHTLHHAGPVVCADGFAEGSIFVAETAWDATSYGDAEFIARARTLIPELVERVEQAERDRDEFRELAHDLWTLVVLPHIDKFDTLADPFGVFRRAEVLLNEPIHVPPPDREQDRSA